MFFKAFSKPARSKSSLSVSRFKKQLVCVGLSAFLSFSFSLFLSSSSFASK